MAQAFDYPNPSPIYVVVAFMIQQYCTSCIYPQRISWFLRNKNTLIRSKSCLGGD